MGENIVITWRELLLVVAVVLAVYIAEMLLVMRASGGLRRPRWLDMIQEKKAEAELRRELEGLRLRVEQLEATLQSQSGADEADTPYSRATLLARQGYDANRLAEECGISRGEAELIISMHQR
ncbi:MAG: hypothetical protein A3B82_00150 [Methylophilales bacterium RIFCSPHIGHO2_02_FULL_57_10]|nr:MAG: hypothetical protein A3B82_00150 [Methylophilales bacterium RIFCSPHIGHO2_02_FULL_57_10]